MTLNFDPEAFHQNVADSVAQKEQQMMATRKGDVMADKTYFVGFNAWDEKAKRVSVVQEFSDKVRKSGVSSKGNAWTRISFTILLGGLDNAVDDKTLRKTEDGHFEILCSVRFSDNKNKTKDAEAFLKSVRADNSITDSDYIIRLANTYIHEVREVRENGEEKISYVPIKERWHRINASQLITVNMMSFSPKNLAIFEATDKQGVPKLRDLAPIMLESLKGEIYVKAYEMPKRTQDEEGKWVDVEGETVMRAGDDFALSCSGVSLAGEEELYLTASDRMAKMFSKDNRPCVPYNDLKSGDKEMPMLSYFYIAERLDIEGWLYRGCKPLTQRYHYVIKEDSEDGTGPIALHTFIAQDVYIMDDHLEKYVMKFKMGSQECQSFGLDMHPDVWVPLQMTHVIKGHILGSFWNKQTEALRANVATQNEDDIAGNYVFYVKRWVPDYKTYLPEVGIPISRDRFFKEFVAKPKPKGKKDDRTYMVLADGDDEQHKFISPYGWNNPLHSLHTKSPVINFGTLERPMFSCDDASEVLFSDKTSFYALVSIPPSLMASKFPGLSGDDLFDAALEIEGGVAYQIFALQNLTDKGEVVEKKKERKTAKGKKKKGKK